jgi:putative FmdB family regulatory protein
MPAYEYYCKDCQKDFMIFLTIREYEEKPKIKCPHCDSDNVHKKLPVFLLKQARNHKKDYYAGLECSNYLLRTWF